MENETGGGVRVSQSYGTFLPPLLRWWGERMEKEAQPLPHSQSFKSKEGKCWNEVEKMRLPTAAELVLQSR